MPKSPAPGVKKKVKDGEQAIRSERYFGKVARAFRLGQEVDENRAEAKYTDGVLTLRLPKQSQIG